MGRGAWWATVHGVIESDTELAGVGCTEYLQGIYDNPFWCQATDALLYTIYALVAVTLLGLILNLTGIFKK